ncbi:MAG: hypothetical protein V3V01_06475 [Acidimicrobiales bacterium]
MKGVNFGIDEIRLSLHILGAVVWLGGQVLMGALVPVLRGISDEAPRKAAARFGQVAWPFFGLAVVTGIWNMVAVSDTTSGYNAVLGIKMLLVLASGGAAFVHQSTTKPAIKGATGGIALITALLALVMGSVLGH